VSWLLSPEAEEELDHASAHYRNQASVAVAAAFLNEFERAARLIDEHSGLGTPRSRGRRLMPLRQFPFSLLYRVKGSESGSAPSPTIAGGRGTGAVGREPTRNPQLCGRKLLRTLSIGSPVHGAG
jgi:plasmid stabilization system protein ParE